MSTKRRDSKGRVLHNGEYQRKDGRYSYKYTDSSGKTKFLYSSRLEKRDRIPDGALEKPSLRELEEQVLRNRFNGIADFGGDLTVLELAERYISTRTSVKESTRAGYQTTLNILKNDPFAQTRIDKVRLSDAKLWLIKLHKKDGRKYSSIHNIRGVLRPAFQMALEDELIRRNPFDFELGSVIADDSRKREALTPEQEEKFLNFIKEDRHFTKYYDAIYILLNTGLRISEFCGLIPDDIDFENECIHVNGQLVRHSSMVKAFETTKTEAGRRDVPMTPQVMDSFRNIMFYREKPLFEPEIDGRSGFFFLDKNGMPMVALHWEHYFQHIRAKYNAHYKEPLPIITPHVCRHTFCSKMARAGMNPKCLQYIMGHSEIAVTMNTYTHLTFDDAKKDMKKVLAEASMA